MNQPVSIFRTRRSLHLTLFGSLVIALLVGIAMIALRPTPSSAKSTHLVELPATQTPIATKQPQATSTPQVAPTVLPSPTFPVAAEQGPEDDMVLLHTIVEHPKPQATITSTTQIGFVTASGIVYQGPGTDYAQVSKVEPNDVVELLVKADGWWWIQTADIQGWVSATLLLGEGEPKTDAAPAAPTTPPHVPDPSAISGLVTMGGAVYAGPGSDYQVIANVEAGTTLELLGATGAWWQVWVGQSVGWINEALMMIPPEAYEKPPAPTATPAPTPVPAPAPAAPAAPAPPQSLWAVKVNPGTLVKLPEVIAPNPRLYADVVQPFLRARTRVLRASGVDYLGRLDEAFRSVDFETTKPGVASMSWHKAGRAIDVAQSRIVGGVEGVAFIRDAGTKHLYRVLIRCAKQDGSLGQWYGPKALGGRRTPGYYVDVTAILLDEGFKRIPPQGAVSEAWHYEMTSGLRWSAAMNQLYPVRMLRKLYPQVWK